MWMASLDDDVVVSDVVVVAARHWKRHRAMLLVAQGEEEGVGWVWQVGHMVV